MRKKSDWTEAVQHFSASLALQNTVQSHMAENKTEK
jgi:hypothetical protein